MPADAGRPGQHLMDGIDTPAPSVAGADAGSAEVGGNESHARRPRASAAIARQAEAQPPALADL